MRERGNVLRIDVAPEQSHIIAERKRPDIPSADIDVDGVAELWNDDQDAMQRAMATPEAKALHADGALFIGQNY